ncbi:hypothetical protein [Stenotrophomonas sp. AS1]
MENALCQAGGRAREVRGRLKDLQEAYGEAMLEMRVRNKLARLLGKDEN